MDRVTSSDCVYAYDPRWRERAHERRRGVIDRNIVDRNAAEQSVSTTGEANALQRGFAQVFAWVNEQEALPRVSVLYDSDRTEFETTPRFYYFLNEMTRMRRHIAVFSISDTGNIYGFYCSGPFREHGEDPSATRAMAFVLASTGPAVRIDTLASRASFYFSNGDVFLTFCARTPTESSSIS